MEDSNMEVAPDLFKFSYLPNWPACLSDLEKKAMPENWRYREANPAKRNQDNPILENYVRHTFARISSLYNKSEEKDSPKWLSIIPGKKACFNTGLYTLQYNELFMYFEANNYTGQQPWKLEAFIDDSDPRLFDFSMLPKRAKYFDKIEDLVFDTELELRVNGAHILNDENNLARIPEEIRTQPNLLLLFNGAIEIVKKRINVNYKTAVPQFFEEKIQLLLPISLKDINKTDLVLVVSRINDIYIGHTCLTLDMAYNNARLISKPEAEWLAR